MTTLAFSTDAYKDLIVRLESVTGPDRELDYLILQAINPEQFARYDAAAKSMLTYLTENGLANRAEAGRRDAFFSCPRFTASLDAAASLVTDGMRWGVGTWSDNFANVGEADNGRVLAKCEPAATPILALCIAALKARSAP